MATTGKKEGFADAEPPEYLRRTDAFFYQCYGLVLCSEIRLPELTAAAETSDPDVIIRQDSIEQPVPSDEIHGCYEATTQEALVYYEYLGQLLIRDGREILIDAHENAASGLMCHIVHGMAMGILLHQRGHLTLHASGVEINGKAAIFAGWKRMGKSTTAAALYAAGNRLLSDDTIVLDTKKPPTVLPGFAQIRLDPEAVAAGLNLDPEEVPRLHPDYRKRATRAKAGFDMTPVPLGSIYCFEWGDDFDLERVPAREGILELIKNSYAQRFLGKAGATPAHFKQVEQIVQTVPMFKITKPRELNRLSELVSLIESNEI